MISPEARVRLASLMDDRRLELGLRWRDVAEAGGVSYEALRDVRNGTGGIRRLTEHAIETGLQWEAGSVGLILAGGDPVPLGGGSPAIADDDALVALESPRRYRTPSEDRLAAIRIASSAPGASIPASGLPARWSSAPGTGATRSRGIPWSATAARRRASSAGMAIVMAYEDVEAAEGKGRRDIRAVLTRR